MSWLKRLFGIQQTSPDPMKYLIVGLGNPGREYENTRHNIGFQILDHLAKKASVEFSHEQHGDLARIKHKGRNLVLLKPMTFMNLSGKAVRYWLQKEKIDQANLVVILDDINLPFGKLRIRPKGSDGGHNGLKDIDKLLGNNKYARLRVGIGRDFAKGRQSDFVLGEWTEEEEKGLSEIIPTVGDAAKSFAAIGITHTMNQFNKK